MSKKKKTLVLLGAVILIYGAVVVRFFSLQNDEESYVLENNFTSQYDLKPIEHKEVTFTIENDYPDPFLKSVTPKIKNIPPPQIAISSDLPEVDIVYVGRVSNAQGKDAVYAIKINGQEYLMKQGKKIEEILLISGTAEAVRLQVRGKTVTLKITE